MQLSYGRDCHILPLLLTNKFCEDEVPAFEFLPRGPEQQSKQKIMARPERFELPTFWFVARRSIQLS